MQSKPAHTEQSASNRRSVSRNLFPLRNNSIRGASMNHNAITNPYNQANKLNSSQHAPVMMGSEKMIPKTLTVKYHLMLVLCGER